MVSGFVSIKDRLTVMLLLLQLVMNHISFKNYNIALDQRPFRASHNDIEYFLGEMVHQYTAYTTNERHKTILNTNL